ncbi:hypothetical protein AIOL_004643 [Candidatus Rhodobacter oscarellae]|uniref:Uncharacterized protein n=1 Tax=Candidatus Rhodobacter oscarellae TaxID=1675527 RepID=A0A0J9EAM4_9RHOB|nr:hypothetical protein AIOL_004643 [Candidatus Rhodobacter lobularis]
MAAAAQAFDDNGFPPFAGIDGSSRASGECAENGTAKSVALIINLAQNSAGPGSQCSSADGCLIKLALVARQRLAGGKI